MQVEGTATSIKTTSCADALVTHGARNDVPTTVLLSMHAENVVDAADLNTPCGEHTRKVECASGEGMVFIEVAVPSTCIERAMYSRI